MTRYARQICLPDVGQEGQRTLSHSTVAIVGAGGLGCPLIQYLAGAGVGHLILCDPDHVEHTNLHRQPIYVTGDSGRPKVHVAQEFVSEFNPDVHVETMVEALHPGNAPDLADRADAVVDAADSFAVSYILSDACLAAKTPLIAASVLGQSGYVGAYCGSVPSLRAVFPDLPTSNATCATTGVLGPVVGAMGSLQAQITLRVLLGADPSPMGQLTTVDLQHMRFGGFSFVDSAEPTQSFPFLSSRLMRKDDLVVELRDTEEQPEATVPTAIRMGSAELDNLSAEHGKRVVLCCSSGLRAWAAAQKLRDRGFGDIALIAEKAFA